MNFSPQDFSNLQKQKQKNSHITKLNNLKSQVLRPFIFKKVHFAVLTLGLFLINGLAGFLVFQQTNNVAFQARASEVLGMTSLPTFKPNQVISDQDFRSFRAFPNSLKIQSFLESIKSPLANYKQDNVLASEIIWQAATGKTSSKYGYIPQINPALILVYLEKEQSLISDKNYNPETDGAKRIKKATGYGCPDDKNCDAEYKGFYNQVNWLSYQLERNFALSNTDKTPYTVGKQVTTLDKKIVTISNSATASIYRYTPHVYWSAYNVWKLMTINNWQDKADKNYSAKEIDNANLKEVINTYATYKTKVGYDILAVKELLKKDWQIGDRGLEISQIQSYLLDTGHYDYDEITGVFGSISQKAVASYVELIKTQEGLKSQIQKEIVAQIPEISQEQKNNQECISLYKESYKMGQKDEKVAKLQSCLKSVSKFAYPTITGKYGKITNRGLSQVLKSPELITSSKVQ